MFKALCVFLLAALCAAPLCAADVAGSADHPMVGRFAGSEIVGYEYSEFDDFKLPEAAGAEGFSTVEGAVTRIAYMLPEGTTETEAMRNFEIALDTKGFATVLACETDGCGGISYDLDQFPIPTMIVDRFNFRLLTARLVRPEGDVLVQIVVSRDANQRIRVQVGVIETAPMENRMVDAAEMQSEVMENGRVALYGIQFDTDSATIKPDSFATLTEIAAFLKAVPDLTVVIVGHTDNQGSLEYNLGLSHRRAEAVRAAMVEQYGIAAERMLFAGAGFLAPVAPNTTEAGRTLNRRVEIIAR